MHALLHALNCYACCISWSALLQANYQLVLPDMEDYLMHIGAQSSWGGIVVGCCDVATLPGALGTHNVLFSQAYCHFPQS